jgi:DNA-binding MarR family transcriptional regulator
MSQLELFTAQRQAIASRHEPYAPFDSTKARQIILSRLLKAGGAWIRRRELRKATGMRPAHVSSVLRELNCAGVIERTDTLPIVHPMHGHMGQTTGYRIRQPLQVTA